jgi:RNA polymerase sigma-70 factor (ECF subfamily)
VLDDPICHEKLYREHYARILRLCRLLLRNQQEAEEVVQEVFLKLIQMRTVQQRDSWDAWLTQVAVNACRDRRRSWWWRWRSAAPLELLDMHLSGGEPTPEEVTVSREQREQIWQFFRRLSHRQQEVFVLRYVEGWSDHQVAAMLGVTPGSVKQHLFRAVQRLRKALRDYR